MHRLLQPHTAGACCVVVVVVGGVCGRCGVWGGECQREVCVCVPGREGGCCGVVVVLSRREKQSYSFFAVLCLTPNKQLCLLPDWPAKVVRKLRSRPPVCDYCVISVMIE